ncbi:beta-1,3-galactosyl-o-glycosyl-glycoprotein beta-1,6-n-acetylglucosaminyltransferase-like [Plakobranchus ocellatus]|uniref:Beta-1,3-galactosyl-o-glycosyl-glycoprotein beta-1,6-n-acetylglucosaminyltransferase-like n=1 Tax=Plakobranchus ocellatus TaxID=259542 RepID=A0AAV3ZDC9_9GAST|nr:beta-1,3-galactosyl-o-glycosyl-glycoprotein beta-1,6-n-acetylglucosaminyltransferase-like [Plakobranchus ocellatus]
MPELNSEPMDDQLRDVKGDTIVKRSSEKLQGPPHGFKVVKGSAYGTFSRAFVAFVLLDKRAQDLLRWCQDVRSPDEYFWATLHHSKTVPVPGAYTAGEPDKKPWLTVYASWGGVDPCATIRKRSVCIFSPEDLPGLLERRELFANKFYITHYPAALHCLDEMLYSLTNTGATRDLSYYDKLPFTATRL